MDKLISIIIPCYNVSPYIDTCIHSLINQTIGYEKIEYIFVNDASTDDTLEKLQKYESEYSDSILLINLSENSKQGTAKNIGMQYASGSYISFCDSDDYVELDMYEMLYNKIIETGANCAVCQKYTEFENGDFEISGPKAEELINVSNELYKCTVCQKKAGASLVQYLFDRDFLERINVFFPPKLSYEDNFFSAILNYHTNTIALINKPLYHYRIHSQSTIHAKDNSHHLDRLIVEVMKIEELKRRGLFEKYYEDIEYQFVMLYFVNTINILLTRFSEIPEGVIKEMQKTVKDLFPNWRKNFLLNYYILEKKKVFLPLIDYPFERGDNREVTNVLKFVATKYFQT